MTQSPLTRIQADRCVSHQAQMRTRYTVSGLADLVSQILARGLDEHQPIVVQATDSKFFSILSGHRRFYAYLLAEDIRPNLPDSAESLPTDLILTQLAARFPLAGNNDLDESALRTWVLGFLDNHPGLTIPVSIFSGDYMQGVLLLQAANFGQEEPDPLGIGHSLLIGHRLGISTNAAAANIGQSVAYVENHLALAQLHELFPALANQIAAGKLPLTLARSLISIPYADMRAGVVTFIAIVLPATINLARLRDTISLLRDWEGFAIPVLVEHPTQRNLARALANLWHERLHHDAAQAWAAAATMAYLGKSMTPWRDTADIPAWLEALSIQVEGHWAAALEPFLYQVVCDACPLSRLSLPRLRDDLDRPQLPCRIAGNRPTRCLHGLAPDDPFMVRVPLTWQGLPGVQSNGNTLFIDSWDALLLAYNAQAARETPVVVLPASDDEDDAEDLEEDSAEDSEPEDSADTPAADTPASSPPAYYQKREPVAVGKVSSAVIGPTIPPKNPAAKTTPPAVTAADHLKAYAAQHGDMAANALVSTACSQCGYQRNEPDNPCAWIGRDLPVGFTQIATPAGPIPVCHQYAPTQPWREFLPEIAAPLPREWYTHHIAYLIEQMRARRRSPYVSRPLMLLLGRVMAVDTMSLVEAWELRARVEYPNLTNGQLAALLMLVQIESERSLDRAYMLPTSNLAQCFLVEETVLAPAKKPQEA